MTQEFRRARRRKASGQIPVTDAMTGQVVGHLGNLSESGMLLLANQALANDALYQLRFPLDCGDGGPTAIEIGTHLLWSDPASAPGQHWIGFRFIGLSERHVRLLRTWVDTPGSQYT